MNLLLELIRELPLQIHLMWAAWVVAGGLLAVWHIRERGAEQSAREEAARAKARTKSGSRPAVAVKPPVKPTTPLPEDAFAELQALLEPVGAEASGSSRRPGE